MGQSSSQLPPAHVEAAAITRKPPGASKRKKSKKSKRKVLDAEEPLDQEQESAQALIQLAQGSVGRAHAHHYENDTRISPSYEAQNSQHQYGPHMTSQDIIARRSQELSSDGRAKRARKRQRRNEVSKALAGLEVTATQNLDQTRPSTAPSQRDQTPSDQEGMPTQRSTHPLDDVSTDDEVERIARGTQEVSQSQKTDDPLHEALPSQSAPLIENSQTAPLGLPSYPDSQRKRTRDQLASEGKSSKRKRKRGTIQAPDTTDPTTEAYATQNRAEDINDSQQAMPAQQGQYRSNNFSLDAKYQEQAELADPFVDQGPDMPIDPVLHSMGAPPPSVHISQTLDQDNALLLSNKYDIEGHHKRGRMREVQGPSPGLDNDGEEVPYYSPYAPLDQQNNLHQSGQTLNGYTQAHNAAAASQYAVRSTEVENLGPSDPVVPAPRTSSPKPSSAKQTQGNGKASEHFGAAEIAQIEAFRKDWCSINNKRDRDFNNLVQSNIRGNPQAVALFNDIQELFPNHRRTYIQRFCRRKFHNYSARGVWSPEEDEMLRQAVAEKGTQWKQVGEMIERFPEDCRDRWRNYLVNTDHRNREQWTEDEVLNLASAIMDCMQTMKAERRRIHKEKFGFDAIMSESESDQDRTDMKLINWQAVSDRMGAYGGGRSRLQCSFKWGKIKQDDRARYMRYAQASRQGFDGPPPNDNTTKSAGWRMKQAKRKVINMLPGDRYDLLQAILNCGAPTEGNIPWKSIGEKWWQGRWSTTERKAAWLVMKSSLPGSEDMDYRDIAYKLLPPLLEHGILDRWDPSSYEQGRKQRKKNASAQTKRREQAEEKQRRRETKAREAAAQRRSKELASGIKSKEIVDDSNDENGEDHDDAYHPPYGLVTSTEHYNRFDPLLTPRPEEQDQGGEIERSEHENANAESVNERDSLFDESEEGETGDTTRMDGKVGQELAQQVLSLQDVV